MSQRRQSLSIAASLNVLQAKDEITGANAKGSDDLQHSKQRNERRRRSSSLAQSHQIRDIIATTVKNLKEKENAMTAEDRLKYAIKDAKESGFSSDRIFSILGKCETTTDDGDSNQHGGDNVVPKQTFLDGLSKLGFEASQQEQDFIIDKFDLNRDGCISLHEFQSYCYNEVASISVAWKAERQRLERVAAASSASIAEGAINETKFDVKDIMYTVGAEVHSTSKLFWKSNLNVNISVRYCSDLDYLTMQLHNAETNEDYDPLFIRKSECVLDQDELEEAANLAVQTSEGQATLTDEEKDLIKQKIHWEFYANYLIARLQMSKSDDGASSYTPSLTKLHGDESAISTTRPSNLSAPQRRRERTSGGGIAEFNNMVESFQKESRSARSSRHSARELSSIAESALRDILAEDALMVV